jgi:hypothetical protein
MLLLAASLHPATAYSAPGDPPSGSPAGAVYQLPLEQGRSDAAPKGNGGTGADAGGSDTGEGGSGGGASGGGNGGGGAAQGESSSLYRSENNFGSSSQVPGATAAGKSGGSAGAGEAGGSGGGGSASGGSAAKAGNAASAETTDTGNTSVPASIVLLGTIALLAAGVGVLSRRFAHRGAVD